MTTLHVLRVFADENARFGNPLGVFLDGSAVAPADRHAVAARLGFSETVFIDDAETGEVEIRTPTTELAFAGHPLVGCAWLLAQHDHAVETLRPRAGEVPTWITSEFGNERSAITWIRGRAEWAPGMTITQHPSAADVDAIDEAANTDPFIDHWAWIDEAEGVVRSRVFAPGVGIVEDEATGAAATRLVTDLDRPLRILQGAGSQLFARPGAGGTAEVGGRVVLVETRDDPAR